MPCLPNDFNELSPCEQREIIRQRKAEQWERNHPRTTSMWIVFWCWAFNNCREVIQDDEQSKTT